MAGYSGTPLATKLGIKPGAVVVALDAPGDFAGRLDPLPAGATITTTLVAVADVVVFFTAERHLLEHRLPRLERVIFPAGGLWVAWPKKASKLPTDITEDTVRAVALPRGLVDNKVCAIDDTWSGLRLVWRKENRGGPAA